MFCNPKKVVPLLHTAVSTAAVHLSFIPLLIKLYLNYDKAHLVKVPLLCTYWIYVNSWIQTKSPALSYGSPTTELKVHKLHSLDILWLIFDIVLWRGFWIFHAFLRFNWQISTLNNFWWVKKRKDWWYPRKRLHVICLLFSLEYECVLVNYYLTNQSV